MGKHELPDLPPKFQASFEQALARSELQYLEQSRALYRFPGLTGAAHFQRVFFAYCEQARNACEAGEWTLTNVRRAVDLAKRGILQEIPAREFSPDEVSQLFESAIRADPGWEKHQREMERLAREIQQFEQQRPKARPTDPTPAVMDPDPPKLTQLTEESPQDPVEDAQSGTPTPRAPMNAEALSSELDRRDGSATFGPEKERNQAVGAYVVAWQCSEAALARTANVHPSDLTKWKKGSLPSKSDKKARIETALRNNQPPTPAANRPRDF